MLQICVLQTAQGRFSKGIGCGLGLLLEGERQQSLALVWGWAISPISFLASQSPQLIKNYLQANIVVTAPMWQEAAGVLLSTHAQHGCSCPLKCSAEATPQAGVLTRSQQQQGCTHRSQMSCSPCWMIHVLVVLFLLKRRKIPLSVLCALSCAPVSCPCERCKK